MHDLADRGGGPSALRAAAVLAVAACLLAGCGGDEDEPVAATTVAAVSTAAPPAGADADAVAPRPQPPSIPRVPEDAAGESFRLERVVEGLAEPVYLTAAPGEPERLYVVERAGLIRGV